MRTRSTKRLGADVGSHRKRTSTRPVWIATQFCSVAVMASALQPTVRSHRPLRGRGSGISGARHGSSVGRAHSRSTGERPGIP